MGGLGNIQYCVDSPTLFSIIMPTITKWTLEQVLTSYKNVSCLCDIKNPGWENKSPLLEIIVTLFPIQDLVLLITVFHPFLYLERKEYFFSITF